MDKLALVELSNFLRRDEYRMEGLVHSKRFLNARFGKGNFLLTL